MENGDPHPPQRQPCILFLDAYDSFTSNIVSLLTQTLNARVSVRHIDLSPFSRAAAAGSGGDEAGTAAAAAATWTRDELIRNLVYFDAVVCGPGPGSPLHAEDVGAFETVWALGAENLVPVLGVCLGFQSLVLSSGGRIRKLKRGLHGMVRKIEFGDQDIFEKVEPFKATLYHSLCADIGQDGVAASEWRGSRFKALEETPDLIPLAWSTGVVEEGEDERILQAVRHVKKPFWGLQYHLESVCTHPAAHDVLRNWWIDVERWNATSRQLPLKTLTSAQGVGHTGNATHEDRFNEFRERYGLRPGELFDSAFAGYHHYSYTKLDVDKDLTAARVAELLGTGKDDTIILDSSSAFRGDPLSLYSIVAVDVDQAPRLTHQVGNDFVTLIQPSGGNESAQEEKIGYIGSEPGDFSPWQILSKFWSQRKLDLATLPTGLHPVFKGGFMGFVTYESGLDALSPGIVPKERGHDRPDICLAWVTRSLVIDHRASVAYIQTICHDPASGDDWCMRVTEQLQASLEAAPIRNGNHINGKTCSGRDTKTFKETPFYHIPDACQYQNKVRQCQDAIREGNSYELCLTDQTLITRPPGNDVPKHLDRKGANTRATPWDIFTRLRSRQPAPFGSFIKLGGATLISSSPERFLQNDSDGLCGMRPMKGTVRKSDKISTLSQAEAILHIPKEEAENLMIVDLVRHDLHGICGAGRVTVPELLKVEEYATVFQMVTNVEGRLPKSDSETQQSACNGLDVLSSVLPPGSMTGAPKKRSCEILHGLEEERERSLYSGVVGYMDVAGKGDWSVTIRTMFKWDDKTAEPAEGEEERREVWHIGAGGAVTILSTPEGEHDEMMTKLSGPLGIWKAME